jgi:SSS family solute:Na+ symporter
MTELDIIILVLYIAGIMAMSLFIGRRQKNQEDYYLGGRKVAPWLVGSSMAANQVSAISLIGAPAFIAMRDGGGLVWLQYEMAVPLAMIVIILVLVPAFRSTGGVTIYRYLEERFGSRVRLAVTLIFLVSRSLATGVALLAAAYVTSITVAIPLYPSLLLIGGVSLAYTLMGGISADIISDVVQMGLLWLGSIVIIVVALMKMPMELDLSMLEGGRMAVFDFSSAGVGTGNTYTFLPMLLGGLFLYISYYGCDQSQAQRILTTADNRKAARSLVINSLIRFPLVLTYSLAGVAMIPFLAASSGFAESMAGMPPDFLIPTFIRDFVPSGLSGLIMAGIFAASMSSLDSAINSLSASTWDDVLVRFRPGLEKLNARRQLTISRYLTFAWGAFAILAAWFFAGGSESVIELVNRVGSAFYGPVAAVFVIGVTTRRKGEKAVLAALAAGVGLNLALWIGAGDTLSWLWWNVTGFLAAALTWFALSRMEKPLPGGLTLDWPTVPSRAVVVLLAWFFVILLVGGLIHFSVA